MASCITPTFGNSNSPQVMLTVEQESATETTAVLSWRLDYVAHGYPVNTSVAKAYEVIIGGESVKTGTFIINGITDTRNIASGTKVIDKVSAEQSVIFMCSMAFNLTWNGTYGATKFASGSIDVAAKTSYEIRYNANGGTGAPSTQTKWHDENVKLTKIKPVKNGNVFSGWGISEESESVYMPGDEYSSNASVTLYAVWIPNNYEIRYNANGGTGAPSTQTKIHGKDLTLSVEKPTKENHIFKGWGLSDSSTTVKYGAGASYTYDSDIELFAIWESDYANPIANNIKIDRCTKEGSISDEGVYALVEFDWKCSLDISSIKIEWKPASSDIYTGLTNVDASGKVGNVKEIVGTGAINIETEYIFRITISDESGISEYIRRLPSVNYIVDFLNGGKGIAVGKPAKNEGLEINMDTVFDKNIRDKYGTRINNGVAELSESGESAIDPNVTLEELIVTDKNTPGGELFYIRTSFNKTKTVESNRMQTGHPCSGGANVYFRTFFDGSWGPWYYITGTQVE